MTTTEEKMKAIQEILFPPAVKQCCGNCHFWRSRPVHTFLVFECRRNAPVGERKFPETGNDDWCGEWRWRETGERP